MAPTRMKLRVRRRNNTSTTESGPPQNADDQPSRSSTTRSSSRRRKNPTTTRAPAPAATTDSPLPSSSSSTTTARPVLAAEDTSPDSKCPICLDRFNNLAYLDRCLHRFCFPCIQEWSHNKAECPLCKQPFSSILHSVRAENDFKEYTLRRSPENGSVAATVAMVEAMANARRVILNVEGEAARHRRRQRRGAVWEWYLGSPPAPPIPALHSLSPVMNAEETQPFDLSERGVIFEGLTGLGGVNSLAPVAANDRATRRLMTQLAARQRLQREGGTVRRLREGEMVSLRRGLYRTGIRVRGVAGGNQDQPQREISAESFCRHPSNLNRLRPWLRRELTVLYGAHDTLINIVQRIIMARVARHGLENLPTVEDELRPFLLARTNHFLHELVSFAHSPLSMENYDLQAVYEPPDAALELDGADSTTDSSSVIAISEEDEEVERRESFSDRADPVQENRPGSCLSLSGWDDETPGPSYSTVDTSCLSGLSPAPHESANEDREQPQQQQPNQEEEECLIVGYKKPIAERTPELVQLSSDSEAEKGQEEKKKEEENKEEEDKMEDKKEAKKKTLEPNVLATTSPPTSFREEIVEDALPSRSHSFSTSPGRSQTDDHHLSSSHPQRRLDKVRNEAMRKKRERRRHRRRQRSSGMFGNPNQSIFPPLTRRFSRSPTDDSSLESSSDDSDWRGYSVISSMSSSCPSTLLSTSSPASCFDSSPSPQIVALTPPPKENEQINNDNNAAAAAAEKPGGKRKYKSRHLDSDKHDPTWKPSGAASGSAKNRSKAKEAERTRKDEREKRRRRRKRHRRDSGDSSGHCRHERSPSVEIVFEGTISSSQAPARKRCRRRQRNPPLNSSPLVITLDSDSCHVTNDRSSSACSSPFGSQQTVDFCHFPALPLVHSSGMGGASLGAGDISELPVDILDHESEKSDAEITPNQPSDPIPVDISNDSETDIDVERVETNKTPISDEKESITLKNKKLISSNCWTDLKEKSPQGSKSDVFDTQLLANFLSGLDLPSSSHFSQDNHFNHTKNHSLVLSNKTSHILTDKNQSSESYRLPPFQQITENRKVPNSLTQSSPLHLHSPNASCSSSRTENANEIRTTAEDARTTHDLDTHREIATSLLALREPERNSPPSFCDSLAAKSEVLVQSSNSEHNLGSTSNSEPHIFNSKTSTENSPELNHSSLPPKDSTSGLLNHKENLPITNFKESDGLLNHTDSVRPKIYDDSAPRLDIRSCNQTETEDTV